MGDLKLPVGMDIIRPYAWQYHSINADHSIGRTIRGVAYFIKSESNSDRLLEWLGCFMRINPPMPGFRRVSYNWTVSLTEDAISFDIFDTEELIKSDVPIIVE